MTLTTPPYEAKIPRNDPPAGGWLTAEQELAAALEGQAPRLARTVAEKLSPLQTAELTQAIRRAVAVGIRRRAEQEAADRLAGVYAQLVDGLAHVECEAVEPAPLVGPPCAHGRTTFCADCFTGHG
jgi:hypothetical protein